MRGGGVRQRPHLSIDMRWSHARARRGSPLTSRRMLPRSRRRPPQRAAAALWPRRGVGTWLPGASLPAQVDGGQRAVRASASIATVRIGAGRRGCAWRGGLRAAVAAGAGVPEPARDVCSASCSGRARATGHTMPLVTPGLSTLPGRAVRTGSADATAATRAEESGRFAAGSAAGRLRGSEKEGGGDIPLRRHHRSTRSVPRPLHPRRDTTPSLFLLLRLSLKG
eukprot:264142-Chlamydomonas_euryale.AAC.3